MHPPRGPRLTPSNVFLSFPFVTICLGHRYYSSPRQEPSCPASSVLCRYGRWESSDPELRPQVDELEVEGRLDGESWRDGGLMTGGKVVGDCSVQKTPAAFGQPRAAMLRR